MKLRYRPGGLRPPDPLRGRVIAFKWPPPEKNPGDASDGGEFLNPLKNFQTEIEFVKHFLILNFD